MGDDEGIAKAHADQLVFDFFGLGQDIAGLDLDPEKNIVIMLVIADNGLKTLLIQPVSQANGIFSVLERSDLDMEITFVEIFKWQEFLVSLFLADDADGFSHGLNSYPGRSILDNSQFSCRFFAQVNDSSPDKRAAVIYPDHGLFIVFQVFYQDICVHGQGFVGSGLGVHIVGFAV